MEEKERMMARDTHRTYQELLRDLRWLQLSQEVKDRKGHRCEVCESDDRLEVHHLGYKDARMPWDYADHEVQVLCRECHENIHRHADQLWNEVLKSPNQWVIYECAKAVKAVMDRHALTERNTG